MISGFDRLAWSYRGMEYLAFGMALQRCRCNFLPDLRTTRHALLLGDGDGRFAEQLFRQAPDVRVLALDSSTAMLAALQRRCRQAGAGGRITTHQANLTELLAIPADKPFDLVTTHFFLDCLSEREIQLLAAGVLPLLTADARWIISEFHVPENALRLPARLLIRSLYFAFRVMTGLRTKRMPRYGKVLSELGFQRVQQVFQLRGLLVSEMWTTPPHIAVTRTA